MDISRIAQKQVVLKLMDNILFNPQRVYNHIVPAVKLDKVKASKGGRILILIASGDSQSSLSTP